MSIPIILDTDIGTDVDDAFALVMAVKEPQIDLKAVTTVYGDVNLRAKIARKFLVLLGHPEIPVSAGNSQPIFDGKSMYWGGWEGKNFLTESDQFAPYNSRPAVTLMHELLLSSSQAITLVGIGPLTNIAILLRDFPEVHRNIAEIICMAGTLKPGDEEWNVQCDPEAANIVFTSGLPIKLGTRHYVNRPWLTQTDRDNLLSKGDQVVKALIDLFDEFLRQKFRTHSPMYDPITLSMAFTDDYLPTKLKSIQVRLENHVLKLEQFEGKGLGYPISVPVDVNPEAFLDYLVDLLLGQ